MIPLSSGDCEEGNRTYKVIDVRPEKAVIVNTQNPNVSIEIGFAAP
jgi:hypothetical protein